MLGSQGEDAGAQQKIARWHWCGVFSELYGGTTETRFANYFDEAMDIHHIFPKHWCDERKIDPRVYNLIINKRP